MFNKIPHKIKYGEYMGKTEMYFVHNEVYVDTVFAIGL